MQLNCIQFQPDNSTKHLRIVLMLICFPDKRCLAFRILVQVPQVWLLLIGVSSLVYVPQDHTFFITNYAC